MCFPVVMNFVSNTMQHIFGMLCWLGTYMGFAKAKRWESLSYLKKGKITYAAHCEVVFTKRELFACRFHQGGRIIQSRGCPTPSHCSEGPAAATGPSNQPSRLCHFPVSSWERSLRESWERWRNVFTGSLLFPKYIFLGNSLMSILSRTTEVSICDSSLARQIHFFNGLPEGKTSSSNPIFTFTVKLLVAKISFFFFLWKRKHKH